MSSGTSNLFGEGGVWKRKYILFDLKHYHSLSVIEAKQVWEQKLQEHSLETPTTTFSTWNFISLVEAMADDAHDKDDNRNAAASADTNMDHNAIDSSRLNGVMGRLNLLLPEKSAFLMMGTLFYWELITTPRQQGIFYFKYFPIFWFLFEVLLTRGPKRFSSKKTLM